MASLSMRYIMLSLLLIGLVYGAPLDGPKEFGYKNGTCRFDESPEDITCPPNEPFDGYCLVDVDCLSATKCCPDGCTFRCQGSGNKDLAKAPSTAFYIHHLSGLCVAVHPLFNRLYMSKSCKEKFELTASKSIKHIKTGKCVVPEDTDDNSLLRLQSDCSTSLSRFQQTALFSIEHSSTGKCLHPLGGNALPIAGTDIVIYRGCDERRLNFEFFVAPPATFSIKHFGGLCVAVNASSNRLYLSKSCKEKFELTGSNYLKHIKTGKCVIPEGPGSNSFLRVQSDCLTSFTFFGQTPKLSIKHLWTRKCFHPLGGSLYPEDGTSIVIYTGCDENRLQFQFI